MLWKTDCDWPFNQPLYKVMGISPLSPSLFIPNHDPDQQSIAQACLFKQLRPLTANLKFDMKLSWFCYMTLLHCCGAFIKDLLRFITKEDCNCNYFHNLKPTYCEFMHMLKVYMYPLEHKLHINFYPYIRKVKILNYINNTHGKKHSVWGYLIQGWNLAYTSGIFWSVLMSYSNW